MVKSGLNILSLTESLIYQVYSLPYFKIFEFKFNWVWHENIAGFTWENFKYATPIAAPAQLGEGKSETIVVTQNEKLSINPIVNLYPMHGIG